MWSLVIVQVMWYPAMFLQLLHAFSIVSTLDVFINLCLFLGKLLHMLWMKSFDCVLSTVHYFMHISCMKGSLYMFLATIPLLITQGPGLLNLEEGLFLQSLF